MVQQIRNVFAASAHHLVTNPRRSAKPSNPQRRRRPVRREAHSRSCPRSSAAERSSGECFDDAAGAAAFKPRAFKKRKIEQCAIAAAGSGFCRCIAEIVDPVEIRKRHRERSPQQPPADIREDEGADEHENGGHDLPQNGARHHMRKLGAVPGSDGQSLRQGLRPRSDRVCHRGHFRMSRQSQREAGPPDSIQRR